MTWYAISAGMCLSAGICHLGLGVKRPVQALYLSFAAMMGFICPFQLVLGRLNAAQSIDTAIAFARYGVALAIAFMTLYAVFVRLYTGMNVPAAIVYTFFAVNAAFLVYDLVSPVGLIRTGSGAHGLYRAPFGALHLVWQAFNAGTVLWGTAAGWQMARRRSRRQGMVLVFGSIACLVTVSVDLLRNLLERAWPYVGGYGVMVMTMILSAQLALDFRNNEILLAKMCGEAMHVRDQLNTPLQTLRFELELAAAEGSLDQGRINRLRRAVDRLTELGRRLRR
jgi:hypothetical protein